ADRRDRSGPPGDATRRQPRRSRRSSVERAVDMVAAPGARAGRRGWTDARGDREAAPAHRAAGQAGGRTGLRRTEDRARRGSGTMMREVEGGQIRPVYGLRGQVPVFLAAELHSPVGVDPNRSGSWFVGVVG